MKHHSFLFLHVTFHTEIGKNSPKSAPSKSSQANRHRQTDHATNRRQQKRSAEHENRLSNERTAVEVSPNLRHGQDLLHHEPVGELARKLDHYRHRQIRQSRHESRLRYVEIQNICEENQFRCVFGKRTGGFFIWYEYLPFMNFGNCVRSV